MHGDDGAPSSQQGEEQLDRRMFIERVVIDICGADCLCAASAQTEEPLANEGGERLSAERRERPRDERPRTDLRIDPDRLGDREDIRVDASQERACPCVSGRTHERDPPTLGKLCQDLDLAGSSGTADLALARFPPIAAGVESIIALMYRAGPPPLDDEGGLFDGLI
jgi:hypothetical protein